MHASCLSKVTTVRNTSQWLYNVVRRCVLNCFAELTTQICKHRACDLYIPWSSFQTPVNMQEEEEDEEAQARGLTGLKVKHTADELQEGETMILTLADKNILDEKGDLSEGEDELENVLAVCILSGLNVD